MRKFGSTRFRVYCGVWKDDCTTGAAIVSVTNRWARVTCGRCLRLRKFAQGKLKIRFEEVE